MKEPPLCSNGTIFVGVLPANAYTRPRRQDYPHLRLNPLSETGRVRRGD